MLVSGRRSRRGRKGKGVPGQAVPGCGASDHALIGTLLPAEKKNPARMQRVAMGALRGSPVTASPMTHQGGDSPVSRPHYEPHATGGASQYTNAPHALKEPWPEEAKNVRLVGHSDLGGWGDAFQIHVKNGVCFVAASGINGNDGFSILDVSNPKKPVLKNQVKDSPAARTHKVLRITDQVLLTNSELRPGVAEKYPDVQGGLRIFDTSDPFNPKFVRYVKVDGLGVHRPVYDPRRKLLYSSGFKDDFNGMILHVHDMKDPWNPVQIGLGWVEGQKKGEKPSWDTTVIHGDGVHLHEARPYLDHYVTCGYWHGGPAMFDLKDPTNPKFMWRQSPHETNGWPGRYHTFIVPEGSEFGIATTETTRINMDEPPAFATFYDLRNVNTALPISTFMPHDIDPYSMRPLDKKWWHTGSRYGAHNLWSDMKKDDLLYICWFNAGLRIVDWSNPFNPKEVGYYMPAGNKQRGCAQSNDVFVDRDTGLIYLSDRWGLGLHILEYTG
jgi:hypothetical protein